MKVAEYKNLAEIAMIELEYASGISKAQVNKFCVRAVLPYGVYIDSDGVNTTEALFNRGYEPLIKRINFGAAENASGWIKHNGQEWFYDDRNPPDRDTKTIRKLMHVLNAFTTGKPLDMFYI